MKTVTFILLIVHLLFRWVPSNFTLNFVMYLELLFVFIITFPLVIIIIFVIILCNDRYCYLLWSLLLLISSKIVVALVIMILVVLVKHDLLKTAHFPTTIAPTSEPSFGAFPQVLSPKKHVYTLRLSRKWCSVFLLFKRMSSHICLK